MSDTALNYLSSAAAPVTTPSRPLVSLVVPAFNEAEIVTDNLQRVCRYMTTLETDYRWEIVFVNDGSDDRTGALADALAARWPQLRVLHHGKNQGLGQAFRTAFRAARGRYIVTLDLDLSYDPPHIALLLTKLRQSQAKIVLASPYMRGGRASNIPLLRRLLSVSANRFLALTAPGQVSTLTSMVRAYDAAFIKSLDLRANGMEIMPEIIYKAMMLGGRIEEIPAHLSWGELKAASPGRRSSMKILRHTLATLIAGFLFKPVMFFIVPGLILLGLALWLNAWTLIHFVEHYQAITEYSTFLLRSSAALEAAFDRHTHTFVVGLLALMLAVQLVSLGVLALQSKHYFEEIYHLGSRIYRARADGESGNAGHDG